jgi:flagellar motor switch protein FliN
MSSEESNEMMEEEKTEKAANSDPVSTDGAETPVEKQAAEEEGVDEMNASTSAAEESSSEEKKDQELSREPESQPESVEGEVEAADSSCDEDPFSEERIQRILDIELPVNISFGSTKRPLSEVLKLGPGALLELDRAAEDPVVLKVNNKVFAKGEIVDVDGYYGVQITEISSPAQRIASLGD